MSKKNKVILSIFLFFAAFGLVSFAFPALAQNQADFGMAPIANSISLSQTDPRIIIGRIIQIALSFLGIIVLGLVIYAGSLWMTSNGDEEKISQAKKILTNAVIGLVIILSAWALTTFFLNRLSGVISGFDNGNNPGNSSNFTYSGLGTIGSCTVESFYPENGQKDVPRNTSIMLTFKEPLKLDSVCVDNGGARCSCNGTTCNLVNPQIIRIFRNDLGDACSDNSCPKQNTNISNVMAVLTNSNKTLILSPLTPLGLETTNTEYVVKVTGDLRKVDGSSMFKGCSSDGIIWDFEVNTRLDLTPPQIVPGLVYPLPDNENDFFGEISAAKNAIGEINVLTCPKAYSPAVLIKSTPLGTSAELSSIILDYHGDINKFKIVVTGDDLNSAQIFNTNSNELLGVADFNSQGLIVFKNFFSFQVASHKAGDSWDLEIKPEQLADTLKVGSNVYTFATSAENNNILVESNCSTDKQALNIQAKLSGDEEMIVTRSNSKVILTARVAGESGNNISLSTTNQSALTLRPFTGGTNRSVKDEVRDKKDNPKNSVIQINFNEAVNPITVSGKAEEVAKYVRVVNASASSTLNGTSCMKNGDCRSYRCESGICRGDNLSGNFILSNSYRTLEFVSDSECGINACGEKIYCLPENSHLAVEIIAANFKKCSIDQDCLPYSPYKYCVMSSLGYKTCQNQSKRNYPTANLGLLDGVVDASTNSLDGNRDTFADGPLDFYTDNNSTDITKKDKYKFSFYINDTIFSASPQITSITPVQGQAETNLADPIKINFNTLMMNSTLRSGGAVISSGTSSIEHKLINLKSSIASPLGYWIENENLDVFPLDGIPDLTIVNIKHSVFSQSLSYKAQVGSGVKDIYQNCFKPSIGPGCVATNENPSCCFGSATNTLDKNGNCQ